eukprot:TRINITY_DN95320_c0_g1_i1.p1 TRINITY_DN95320_c0_g1~~TRINITY_DN95320_c0_g1_i1.p1  ORF type:complete len:356 (+),score=34.96 TRINITY_DN95320_c0_g1_i1:51-1118(+)
MGSWRVCWAVFCYTICSSFMLVANKVTMHYIPLPATVAAGQLLGAVLCIWCLKNLQILLVDELKWESVKTFIPYMAGFVASVYASGKSLEKSNMETIIVFRACSPLCVSVLDWLFLGRELPSIRSLLSLLAVLAGAIGYMSYDSAFQLNGFSAYSWVMFYLAAISFEMTYGKKLISGVKFQTPVWGAVFYTNVLGLPPMVLLMVASGELEATNRIAQEANNFATVAFVLSVIMGIGIGWSGWNCRNEISATAYTLVGVCCKFISVLLNILIWDKHATPQGIACLMVCLVAGTAYRQAPPRVSPPIPSERSYYVDTGASKLGKAGGDGHVDLVEEECLVMKKISRSTSSPSGEQTP